jgi:hypothetical protein
MTRLFLTAVMVALAACSSNTNNAGTTTVTDVVTTSDTKASDGTGTADTGASADAADAKADTSTKDVPPAPVLCKVTDAACMAKCGNDKCDAPQKACDGDKGCKALVTCLNGCVQKPPVSPPDDVTGTTCEDKCVTLAKEVTGTVEMYAATVSCVYGNCVQCSKTDKQCTSVCAQGKCTQEINDCQTDAECSALNACVNAECATDPDTAGCAQKKCAKYLTQNAVSFINAAGQCINDAKTNEPACTGK